jgi:hypothetical protein
MRTIALSDAALDLLKRNMGATRSSRTRRKGRHTASWHVPD